VYQLETAMGAAISVFPGSQAIRVPRTRFLPVKTTSDLFIIHSDAFIMTGDSRIVPNPDKEPGGPPLSVTLDSRFYKHVDQLESRFPFGPPSLIDCERVMIWGDIKFGKGIVFRDAVKLINDTEKQVEIEDGSIIEGTHAF